MSGLHLRVGPLVASLCLLCGGATAQVVTEFSAGITAGAQPLSITPGPDGNLRFTEDAGNRIARITPAGVVTEFNAGISPGARLQHVTAGPDGNLWFTELNIHRIGRITTLGVVTEFSAGISPGAEPWGITAGPDGNLWFTEGLAVTKIGRITPAGVVTEFSAGITPGGNLVGITSGPDGNLWFAEENSDRIGRITPAGVVTEFSAGITAGAGPHYITAGPDGNLWFTERLGNRIGRITPLGVVTEFSVTGAKPWGITAGPDGNLWFTEFSGNQIGRITPLGIVTEFSAGISVGAGPIEITAGPDGNLWFAEFTGNRIGRITTGALSARLLVPDGTSESQTFSAYPETRWFALMVEPGKTYVIDAVDPSGDLTANAIGTLNVFAGDGVSAPPEASVDCTAANGPRPPAVEVASDGLRCVLRTGLPTAGMQQNKRAVFVKVTRFDPALGGGAQFKIRAREATIYGRWLTAGYDYHVEVENTTGDALCVEVARYPASGLTYTAGPGWAGSLASFTLTVPPFGAVKQVIASGSLVGADSEGALRLSACAAPTNLLPAGLHVSTYAFDTVGNRYIYFFTSTANEGKTRSTW